MMFLFFFFLFFYFILSGSFHSFFVLISIEYLILIGFFLILNTNSCWLYSVLFLFFSVCLSSYGLTLMIDNFRSKGSFYSLSMMVF